MKNARKLALLGACLVSSLGLAGCSEKGYNVPEDNHVSEGWIITEIGKKDVLFDAKNIYYGYEHVGYAGIGSGSVQFTANHDDKTYVASEFFIFEHDNKPSKELYDVEYGTKEWNDLYNTTANYSNIEESNL